MAKNASKDKSGAKKPEAVQAAKTVQAATADVAPVSVRSSAIHIGISDKDRAAISKGLSAGDLVVTEGVQKVRPGQEVDATVVQPEA